MPIIEIPQKNSPLRQGDILRNISLYLTGDDWSSIDRGSAEHLEEVVGCLVVSRPCVLANKNQVVVAAIHRLVTEPPKTARSGTPSKPEESASAGQTSSFKEHCTWFDLLRDGVSSPDRFYLGRLPGFQYHRHSAHFDSLHTLRLPPVSELAAFLSDHRVARLASDFTRSLHTRLFRCFAELGFEDYSWYETEDLELIVNVGEMELKRAEAVVLEKKAVLQRTQLQGKAKEAQISGMAKGIQDASKAVEEIQGKLRPYNAELNARRQNADQESS